MSLKLSQEAYIFELEQKIKKLKEALNWYKEHAESCHRNQNNPDSLLAIITTLNLDNGSRANKALNLPPNPSIFAPTNKVPTPPDTTSPDTTSPDHTTTDDITYS